MIKKTQNNFTAYLVRILFGALFTSCLYAIQLHFILKLPFALYYFITPALVGALFGYLYARIFILNLTNIQNKVYIEESENHYKFLLNLSPVPIVVRDWSEILETLTGLELQHGDLETFFKDKPAMLRGLFSNTPLIGANQHALEMYAAKSESEYSDNVETYRTDQAIWIRFQAALNFLKGQYRFESEYESTTASGKSFASILRLTLESGYEKNWSRVILMITDISEFKKHQAELAKTEKLEAVKQIARGIAHDFNNLLYAILGNIELTMFELDRHTEIWKNQYDAKMITLRARDLVHRFLSVAGEDTLNMKRGDIQELFRSVTDRLLLAKNVQLKCSRQEDLWTLSFESESMEKAIEIVITNALEAMSNKGQIELFFENFTMVSEKVGEFEPFNPGDYVKIKIIDTGVGIPPENLGKVFDPYFTTKPMGNEKGMGLGLAHCYSIIKKHSGYIFVSSEGEGTRVYIYLPTASNTSFGFHD